MHLKTKYFKYLNWFQFSGDHSQVVEMQTKLSTGIKAVRTAPKNSVPKLKQAFPSCYKVNSIHAGAQPKAATKTRFFLRKFIGTLNVVVHAYHSISGVGFPSTLQQNTTLCPEIRILLSG